MYVQVQARNCKKQTINCKYQSITEPGKDVEKRHCDF